MVQYQYSTVQYQYSTSSLVFNDIIFKKCLHHLAATTKEDDVQFTFHSF